MVEATEKGQKALLQGGATVHEVGAGKGDIFVFILHSSILVRRQKQYSAVRISRNGDFKTRRKDIHHAGQDNLILP